MGKDLDVVSLNKLAWEKVADKYDHRRDIKVGSLFEAFKGGLREGGRVLDIGSGTGLPYAGLLIEGGFDVLGIDFSSRMVEIARENVPGAEFVEMSMTDLAFEGEFDGAFSVFSMLLLDPAGFRDVAAMVFRALRDGGLFYLALNEPREEGADVDGEAVVEIMGEVMYSRAYTVEEVRRVFLPLGVEELMFHREIQVSEEFGEEHVIEFLFRKP